MSEVIAVEHVTEGDHRGAFVFERGGERLAEMSYTRAGEAIVIIDHTTVHEGLKGLGVGRKLLDGLVAWARAERLQVVPVCPYAKAQFDKDPSIRDVLQSA